MCRWDQETQFYICGLVVTGDDKDGTMYRETIKELYVYTIVHRTLTNGLIIYKTDVANAHAMKGEVR